MCNWCYILDIYPEGLGSLVWDYKILVSSVCFECFKSNAGFDESSLRYTYENRPKNVFVSDIPLDYVVKKEAKYQVTSYYIDLEDKKIPVDPYILRKMRIPPDDFFTKFPQFTRCVPWRSDFITNFQFLTWEFVESHPEGLDGFRWDVRDLCKREIISFDFIEKHPKGFNGQPWDVYFLGKNPALDWDFVQRNPNGINGINWHIYSFILNPSLDFDFIQKYFADNNLSFNQYFYEVCTHPKVSFDFLLKNFDDLVTFHKSSLDWRVSQTKLVLNSLSRTAPWDFITKNPDGVRGHPWIIEGLCLNPDISFEYIDSHPEGFCDEEWNMHSLSQNPSLNMDFVEKHINGINGRQWFPTLLSAHPNLTWDFVSRFPNGIGGEKWECESICRQNWKLDCAKNTI